MNSTRLPGGELYEETAKTITEAGKKLREHGITLAYHNHTDEFEKHDGKLKFDLLMDRVGPENLVAEIDTGWTLVGGIDPAEFVLKYSGRVPLVHIKDVYFESSEESIFKLPDEEKKERHNFEFRPVCEGLLDVPSIVAAAEKAGAFCIVFEQDAPSMGMTAMECAVRSMSNFKKL
jgi:sugar phosphate isomerase/epimerase